MQGYSWELVLKFEKCAGTLSLQKGYFTLRQKSELFDLRVKCARSISCVSLVRWCLKTLHKKIKDTDWYPLFLVRGYEKDIFWELPLGFELKESYSKNCLYSVSRFNASKASSSVSKKE